MQMAMRMKALVGATVALAGLAAAACAPIGESAAPRAKGPPQPSMWVVRDADSTIYLYGTIHLLKDGDAWGGPAAQSAIAQASEIWTEIEIDPAKDAAMQAMVMQLGLDPTKKLSERIDPAYRTLMQTVITRAGLQPAVVDMMRPWLAGLTFSVVPMMQAGYDPEMGVDRQIDALGDANGKTMRWFETAEEQLQFLAGLSEPVQMQMLYESLKEFEKGATMLDAMAGAWKVGDDAALQAIVVDQMKQEYPELYDVILTQRNKRWADALANEMKGAGVDFVAVGAAHLLGPDSVQAFLAQKGYRAEQVAP